MAGTITISDAELAGALKNVNTDIRQKLFPIATATMAQFKKGRKGLKWGGNGVFFDTVHGPPVNGAWSDAGNLGQTSQAYEKQGSSGVRRFYVTRTFDNLGIVGTASKEAAFVSLKEKITDEIDGAMQLGLEEALNGNGLGIKAIVTSAADTTHCVATSPYGVVGAGQGGLWIYPGAYLAVIANDGVSVRGKAYVTSVTNTGDNVSIVWASAIAGQTGGDFIVQATANDMSYGQLANGLQNLLNVGGSYDSLHGIDAANASTKGWNTFRMTAGTDTDSATDPNNMDVWKLMTKLGTRSGNRPLSSPNEFFLQTTYGLGQKFIASYLADVEITSAAGATIDIDGGYKAASLHGVPMILSEYSAAGNLYCVHKPSIRYVDAADWSPVQYEGSGSIRWVDGKDAFSTSFKTYFNTITTKRNAHAVLGGYTDTDRYTAVI